MDHFETVLDVSVYIEGSNQPILANGFILAAHSQLFANVLSMLNFCDGCTENKVVIITGEDKETVEQVLQYLHKKSENSMSNVDMKMLDFVKRFKFDTSIIAYIDDKIPRIVEANEIEEAVIEPMSLRSALIQIANEISIVEIEPNKEQANKINIPKDFKNSRISWIEEDEPTFHGKDFASNFSLAN